MSNRTFTIIKPNAVAAGNTGKILAQIIADGFRIRAMKMVFLDRNRAERFYAVHKGKPFFPRLVMFMTSGPIVVAIVEKQNAVAELRRLVGATDPAKAEEGTIRRLYADSMSRNAIHASDSDENAAIEWSQFFSVDEIMEADYFLPLPESEC
ncbi:MAG: nucleoside-diphosphate kinase [Rikenellaceae bacterium]|jgi:nucleoside-diphosphate kinase|nr:nucleoside-diphosphate kinase [Rikenellaceae bacterium]